MLFRYTEILEDTGISCHLLGRFFLQMHDDGSGSAIDYHGNSATFRK